MPTETEWLARMTEGRARVERVRARLAAGETETETARAEGFATRRDIDARVSAVLARRSGGAL